jgi:hypothetical protein
VKSGLRRALRNSTPVPMGSDRLQQLPGVTRNANPDLMSIRAYKENGTVNANVGLLASSVAAPAWKLYRSEKQDGRVRYTTNDQGSDERTEVVQHAALSLLNSPAVVPVQTAAGLVQWPAFTRMTLFELSGLWLETTGKSHWVVDSQAGIPVGLWPVRPDRMIPVPSARNFLAGYIYISPDGREKIPLLPTEVIYNRYPDPEDIYGGAGPIGSVLTDIDSARYAAEFNRNYFINSAEPGGVLVVDHQLDDEEFNDLVNRWRESHRGVARAHRIAVLEGGQTWVPNPHSLKDMDFANLRGTSRDIIREALGMHKVMTGVTDDVNRANAQTGEEVFASWKVAPRLDRWRDVLNTQYLPLFGKTGQGVEFDYSYPTPQNREQDALELTSKTTAFGALVDAGVDPDDAAEVVGLPKMRTVERATQAPAIPPGWVPAPPAGADDPAAAAAAALRRMDPWDRLARQSAAWNALAGAR